MQPGRIPAVDRHYTEMQRLEMTAVALMVRLWSRIDRDNLVESWDAAAAAALGRFTDLQLAAATAGAGYNAAALRDQGLPDSPEAQVIPAALAGVASDGRPLETLLRTPLETVAVALDKGWALAPAMRAGRASVRRIAHTQIGDAGRAAAGVDIAARPGVGWTRMLTGKSCSRCAVLAGRVYRWNAGFDRHPQDDCVHVATSAAAALREGLVDDPKVYFDSLSREEQDKRFTKAGAQAIRDGADIGQIVNARRGMSTAGRDQFGNRVGRLAPTQVFGQDVFTTLEGTTRRGLAGQRLIAEGARLSGERAETVRRITRKGEVERVVTRQRVQIPRLMPETIYQMAKDRDDALRLLRRFGYIR